jgi:hypothetical protein
MCDSCNFAQLYTRQGVLAGTWVCLGWYDGCVHGYLLCAACKAVYMMRRVAESDSSMTYGVTDVSNTIVERSLVQFIERVQLTPGGFALVKPGTPEFADSTVFDADAALPLGATSIGTVVIASPPPPIVIGYFDETPWEDRKV